MATPPELPPGPLARNLLALASMIEVRNDADAWPLCASQPGSSRCRPAAGVGNVFLSRCSSKNASEAGNYWPCWLNSIIGTRPPSEAHAKPTDR